MEPPGPQAALGQEGRAANKERGTPWVNPAGAASRWGLERPEVLLSPAQDGVGDVCSNAHQVLLVSLVRGQ